VLWKGEKLPEPFGGKGTQQCPCSIRKKKKNEKSKYILLKQRHTRFQPWRSFAAYTGSGREIAGIRASRSLPEGHENWTEQKNSPNHEFLKKTRWCMHPQKKKKKKKRGGKTIPERSPISFPGSKPLVWPVCTVGNGVFASFQIMDKNKGLGSENSSSR
jgi:hypothetical protein